MNTAEDILKRWLSGFDPAHPVQMSFEDGSSVHTDGMGLVDWFAGLFAQAMVNQPPGGLSDDVTNEQLAVTAYDLAEALYNEGIRRRAAKSQEG